jgi:hypothetical protein
MLTIPASAGATPLTASPAGHSAVTSQTVVKRSSATFTSYPGLAAHLLSNGILPLPADGGVIISIGHLDNLPDLTMSMRLPFISGEFDPHIGRGYLQHRGGMTFVNPSKDRSVTVSRLDVVLDGPKAAHVVATLSDETGGTLRLFNVDADSLTLDAGTLRLSNARLVLTAEGSVRLNAAVGTTAFTTGEICGTADVTATL